MYIQGAAEGDRETVEAGGTSCGAGIGYFSKHVYSRCLGEKSIKHLSISVLN